MVSTQIAKFDINIYFSSSSKKSMKRVTRYSFSLSFIKVASVIFLPIWSLICIFLCFICVYVCVAVIIIFLLAFAYGFIGPVWELLSFWPIWVQLLWGKKCDLLHIAPITYLKPPHFVLETDFNFLYTQIQNFIKISEICYLMT